MIRALYKLPERYTIAASGGKDSMAVLDFLNAGNKVEKVLYFDHKTDQSTDFLKIVKEYCEANCLPLDVGTLQEKKKGGSWESFWSENRNKFYRSQKGKVITGHNLDDAVEWWVFTSLRGEGKLMPSRNHNVLRPFLSTTKTALEQWVSKNNVPFCEDVSNRDTKFTRNFIRHELMPYCLRVNPGIRKTIFKKLKEREDVFKSR